MTSTWTCDEYCNYTTQFGGHAFAAMMITMVMMVVVIMIMIMLIIRDYHCVNTNTTTTATASETTSTTAKVTRAFKLNHYAPIIIISDQSITAPLHTYILKVPSQALISYSYFGYVVYAMS